MASRVPTSPEAEDERFGEYLNAGDLDGPIAPYERSGTLVGQDGEPLVGQPELPAPLRGS